MKAKLILPTLMIALAVPVLAQTRTGTEDRGSPNIDRVNPNSGDSAGGIPNAKNTKSGNTKQKKHEDRRETSGGRDTEDRGNPSIDRVNPRSGDSVGGVPNSSKR